MMFFFFSPPVHRTPIKAELHVQSDMFKHTELLGLTGEDRYRGTAEALRRPALVNMLQLPKKEDITSGNE